MRLLHMADAHFGKRFASSRFGSEAAARRRDALEDALRRTVDYANENGADYILCAGDLIESEEARPSDLRKLDGILSGLKHAKVYAVAGNHDPLNESSPYLRLKSETLTVLPPGYSRTMLNDETALHAFSFPEAAIRSNPLEKLPLDMSAPRNLLLLHCDAIGAESEYLPARLDFLKRFDYCALGHVHQPLLLAPGVRYSGSLIGLDRNETGQRGFVALDLADAVRDRFVPLPLPTYEAFTLELASGADDERIEARLREELQARPAENLYSVTLTGAHTAGAKPDTEALTERLRSGGYTVYLIDRTRPSYDLRALTEEHRDDLIGQVVNSFGPPESLNERDHLALEYALAALMEGGRRA